MRQTGQAVRGRLLRDWNNDQDRLSGAGVHMPPSAKGILAVIPKHLKARILSIFEPVRRIHLRTFAFVASLLGLLCDFGAAPMDTSSEDIEAEQHLQAVIMPRI
jgi:hypothetical protein